MRALHPEVAEWSSRIKTNSILADAVDVAQWANYQRGGGRGSKPKPYPRPGDRQRKKFGTRLMSPAEAREWLAKRRQGLPA